MPRIEINLDEQTLERARRVAEVSHCSVEELVSRLLDLATPPPAGPDPLFGMMADEPGLVDQVLVMKNHMSLEGILAQELGQLPRLAESAGLEKPRFVIADKGILVNRAIVGVLRDMLTQCLRNSIDHGIEPGNERLKERKNTYGSIYLELERQGPNVLILYRDDGRGLNLGALAKKAQPSAAKPFATDLDIAMQIFESGVTSKDQVTMGSGRGVGMDIVRAAAINLGGHVAIQFLGETTPQSFRPFRLVIALPAPNFYIPDEQSSHAA